MGQTTLFSDLQRILGQVRDTAVAYAPAVLGAIIILLVGLLVAWAVRLITARALSRLHRLITNRRLRGQVQDILEEKPVIQVIAGFLYWMIIFLFLTAATETLGLPIVTTWIGGLAGYLPRILTGVLILMAGVVGGMIMRDLILKAALTARVFYAGALAKAVQIVIVLVSVLVAADQVGIDVSMLQGVVLIAAGAFSLGAALAFGLGARPSVQNILAAHYLQKRYHVGDRIELEDGKGTIVEITPYAIVLDTERGLLSVPTSLFNQKASLLLPGEHGS